jgi:hypothetical protein
MTKNNILGKTVVDALTGFEGIAVATTEWLYGCERIGVQSKELKDGAPCDLQWFDVLQLTVKPGIGAETAREPRFGDSGGPRSDPTSKRHGE